MLKKFGIFLLVFLFAAGVAYLLAPTITVKTPEKNPALDPYVQGNASIGGGKNADPGPGELQPTMPATPPPIEPFSIVKDPHDDNNPADINNDSNSVSNPSPYQTPPPAAPIPIVEDSHGSAGENNGPFALPT